MSDAADVRDAAEESLVAFGDVQAVVARHREDEEQGSQWSASRLRRHLALRLADARRERCRGAGAQALAAALKMANFDDRPARLAALRLANCRIHIKGAETLGQCFLSGAAPHLTVLDLSTNSIQDSGAAAIAKALKNMPNLRLLRLGYNNLSEAADFALKSHLATTSNSSETTKLLALEINMEGNVCDEGLSAAPNLARSKINTNYPPTSYNQRLLPNPFITKPNDLQKSAFAMAKATLKV